MKDYIRENLSYFGMFRKLIYAQKILTPEKYPFGEHRDQYILYYEPERIKSDRTIIWIHGGGWNAGTPEFFDFVGQAVAAEGFRFVSIGYRLSPENKYPCQIEDVCRGFNEAVNILEKKGADTSKLVVSGPSAGAHLSALMCFSKNIQEKYEVDVSGITGYIGAGGPFKFEGASRTVNILLGQLFEKDYDRSMGEPCSQMSASSIPSLIIHSRHDGLIDFSCAERFCEKAAELGNSCELYEVTDSKNTHSWYTAGNFLEKRENNKCLDKFFTWIEKLDK